jgi:hypothetical protein
MKKRSKRLLGWSLVVLLASCQPDMSDDPIPFVAFPDFVANLMAPEYQSLAVVGGYKEINSIGVRGVIVYRLNASTYLAFERNCSFRPNEACATVNVHSSSLYMIDPCCNSSFSFDNGSPTGGAASRPLRQYDTQLVGSELTITDDPLN